jgi:hypothetical protein
MTTLIKATPNPISIPSGSATNITLTYTGGPDVVSIAPTQGFSVSPSSHALTGASPDVFTVTITRTTSATQGCVLLFDAGGSSVHAFVKIT